LLSHFELGDIFHNVQPLVLLVDLLFSILLLGVMLFLVNSFAFAIKAFFVFLLFVVYVFLKARMHFQGGIKPIFDCVVCAAGHVFGD